MDTHCLLAPPAEKVLRTNIPEGDYTPRIKRDETVLRKTLDRETNNVLGSASVLRSRLLSHGTAPIECRAG